MFSYLAMPSTAIVGIAGCVFLHYCHPSEIWWIPRYPFYELTGCRCPGCGMLRGIYRLFHFLCGMGYESTYDCREAVDSHVSGVVNARPPKEVVAMIMK